MKNRWLAIAGMLPILMACNGDSSMIHLSSETVSQAQIDTIISNINQLYPKATLKQRQSAAATVVQAIEELVYVEGGSFEMGDFGAPCDIPSGNVNRMDWSPGVACLSLPDSGETGAAYLHKVTLDAYSIAKFETRVIHMERMRQINNLPVAKDDGKGNVLERGSEKYQWLILNMSNYPTNTKGWQEAKDYCQWLGKISSLPFDLPTEAQWEYAARSRGQYYYFATNNGYRQLYESHYIDSQTGGYMEYSETEANASTSVEVVDAFPPNPLGIYGMSNQASEWVNDWYSPDYYQNSPKLNPEGPESGSEKVQRDGGGVTMTFSRLHNKLTNDSYFNMAFRCALQ
jgi:formylglycine-generating enzyme required for sulfatase activity